MRPKIIFLSGSINAGKSTVARLLVENIKESALVEIDDLRRMIDWMPLDRSIPLNLENAVSVIKNFVGWKLNVIIPYPISRQNHDFMKEELKDIDAEVYFFTLAPQIERALSNRGARELGEWEKERIQHHYNVGIQNPEFGEIIDNSEQTPEETANVILDKLGAH